MQQAVARRAVADFRPGDHLCCLFDSEEDHRTLLGPFLRQGIERGEKLIYIVDAHAAEVILGYLRDDGVDVAPLLASGQLAVLSVEDAYVRDGTFDPDAMIALLGEETRRALAEGYPALRVTGEMSWALRNLPGSERLIEYESKLTRFFRDQRVLAICQYDRRRFQPAVLLDVLTTHPLAVLGTTVHRNFYFMPPEEFLGPDRAAATLHRWMQNLEQRTQLEAALREADERKSQFLSMLSHELRNPLTPIKNSLFVLDRAPAGSDQARRAHTVIDRQVGYMARLIDDLLDITRIARGKIALQREPVDLAELVRRTVEDYRAIYAANAIALTLSLPEEPVWLRGDATRLAQVVSNLLGNSAKFAAGGQVAVAMSRAGGDAVLHVRDTGVGVDVPLLERIFEPFAQEDRTLDRSSGGLGLGLALVKGLVELHGGRVAAASEGPGRGTELTVVLPADASARPAPDPDEAGRRSRRRRILIIEDNLDAAESLREALELEDHDVAVAYNGPSGLDRARELRPEVVLCDIGLPQMTGYDVARAFRADAALRDTWLVALTGYALPEDRAKAMAAGFDRHLAKPPSLDQLDRILADLTRGPR